MVVSDGSPSVKHAAAMSAGRGSAPPGTWNVVLHDPAPLTGTWTLSGNDVDETDT
jgi:hypothetical protein